MGATTDFRPYGPGERGPDGYPVEWHRTLKHAVREEAGHRCVRCGHPFVVGDSGVMEGPCAETKAFTAEVGVSMETFDAAMENFAEVALDALPKARRTNWSRCDERCRHGGPMRWLTSEGWKPLDDEGVARELVYEYGARVEAAWRILTVHHLDGDKGNCRWWNLVALCQRCHLTVQGKVQMARVYPWEHSGWFRPYVAGYYAHTYLGEDLTRQEVEVRIDELLALECVVPVASVEGR